MKDKTKSFLGELRLSRHLQSITQVSAVGLAVALGLSFIYFSTCKTARDQAGV